MKFGVRGLIILLAGGFLFVNSDLLKGTSVAFAKKTHGLTVVDVVAKDDRFEIPKRLPGGPILFHFTNKGMKLHHMTIVKFEKGKTFSDFTRLHPGPMPSWVVFFGGPNAPLPRGGQSKDIVVLSPGHYAVICLIPDRDGKPHMMSGMASPFTVTAPIHKAKLPTPDLTLTLRDYDFSFSSRPTRGQHVIRVINDGSQMHEAIVFHLMAGKKGEDISKWIGTGMVGPPPGAPAGGVTPMSPGKSNLFLTNLKSGKYALLCFVPSPEDGKPHAMHGMVYNFTVE